MKMPWIRLVALNVVRGYIHIFTKEVFESVLMRWMNLKLIVQDEVSLK